MSIHEVVLVTVIRAMLPGHFRIDVNRDRFEHLLFTVNIILYKNNYFIGKKIIDFLLFLVTDSLHIWPRSFLPSPTSGTGCRHNNAVGMGPFNCDGRLLIG